MENLYSVIKMKRTRRRVMQEIVERKDEVIFKISLRTLREMKLLLSRKEGGKRVRKGIVELHIFRVKMGVYMLDAEVFNSEGELAEERYGICPSVRKLEGIVRKALENELDVVRYGDGVEIGIEESELERI